MRQRHLWQTLLLFCMSASAGAADFTLDYTYERPPLKMMGVIESGDGGKLVATVLALADRGGLGSLPRRLEVDSSGGSVQEAARIASLIELLRMSTSVPGTGYTKGGRAGICASACFLVWLAGHWRFAAAYYGPNTDGIERQQAAVSHRVGGMVGLHRPYLDLSESTSTDMVAAQSQQRRAIANLRTYLQNRNVSSELIGRMMAHSSKNIYWLRPEEVNALANSPEYEELLAANCGYRNTILTSESSRADIEASLHESSSAVQAKLATCSRELIGRLRALELPILFAQLRKGWRPWTATSN